MRETVKIYVSTAEDRLELVGILAKNGYTVRIGRERPGNRSAYRYFVEYGREGEDVCR